MKSSRKRSGNRPNWLENNTNSRSRSGQVPEWMTKTEKFISTDENDVYPLSEFICDICKSAIGLGYFICHQGSIFHPRCYTSHNILQCAICGNLIVGQYSIDTWGNAFCAYHKNDMLKCSICGRYICKAITGGGRAYQDGRYVCGRCRSEAVDTAEQANRSLKYVRDVLGKKGFLIDESLFPIRLIDVNEMHRLQKQKSAKDHALGLFQGIHLGDQKRRIEAVNILWGMPKYIFEGTLAHELGHAWLFLNHVDNLTKQTEEGLCNLLKFVVHADKLTLNSLHEIQGLFRNTDLDYGEGFRMAAGSLKQFTLGSLVRYVAKRKSLPTTIG